MFLVMMLRDFFTLTGIAIDRFTKWGTTRLMEMGEDNIRSETSEIKYLDEDFAPLVMTLMRMRMMDEAPTATGPSLGETTG